MQRLEVSGAVRPLESSLDVKGLRWVEITAVKNEEETKNTAASGRLIKAVYVYLLCTGSQVS